MSNDANDSWLKFLNPDSLKQNLIRASLYLTCWEMLKQCLVDQVHDFYSNGWKDGKSIMSPNYEIKVLNLDKKDRLIASALWFKNQGALSDAEIATLRNLRGHRNEIAHELPKFLGTLNAEVKMEYFEEIYSFVEKLDKWWIQNIEIATNPDLENLEFTDQELDGVQSMRMVMMRLLIQLANGKEEDIRWIYEEMKKAGIKGK
jgi:hypothetical protein